MSIVRSPMTLVMLTIFTVMVGVASPYPGDARFMPFVVGIPAIGLCLLQLFLDWRAGEPPEASDNRTEMEKAEERVSKMVGPLPKGSWRAAFASGRCGRVKESNHRSNRSPRSRKD